MLRHGGKVRRFSQAVSGRLAAARTLHRGGGSASAVSWSCWGQPLGCHLSPRLGLWTPIWNALGAAVLLLWAAFWQGRSPAPSHLGQPHRWPVTRGFCILNPKFWVLYREEENWKGVGRCQGLRDSRCVLQKYWLRVTVAVLFPEQAEQSLWLIITAKEKIHSNTAFFFFFLFPSFLLGFYSDWFFGLQIVLFVFITKLRNKTWIIQFVRKAIKRLNVFLLLAGWLCLVRLQCVFVWEFKSGVSGLQLTVTICSFGTYGAIKDFAVNLSVGWWVYFKPPHMQSTRY